MRENIKHRKVLEAENVDDKSSPSVKDDGGEAVKSKRSKSQRKDETFQLAGVAAISEEEEGVGGDGELNGEKTRVRDSVDLGQLLLPPLVLLLIHLAGLIATTILLICALSLLYLVEYIS